jgi:hypothetical protein
MISKEELLKELEVLFTSFTSQMLSRYSYIRENYRFELHNPEYDFIRKEICTCLIMGLDQAAITLTNHLLEKFLRLSLIYKEIENPLIDKLKGLDEKYKLPKDKYADKDLSNNINQACSKGIITKDEKKILHKYREEFRNGYSHADMDKTFKNIKGGFGLAKLDGSVPFEYEELQISDIPPLQGILQKYLAETTAMPYFLYLDGIIKREEIKNHPNIVDFQNK